MANPLHPYMHKFPLIGTDKGDLTQGTVKTRLNGYFFN